MKPEESQEKQIKWFDLGRFDAALKVVPNSPLRGTSMTCLEVRNEPTFVQKTLGDAPGRQVMQEWRDQMQELGFSMRPEFYEKTDESRGQAFRLYSGRTTFTLAEMQRIVPGVTADDFKLLPVAGIVHQQTLDPEMAGNWKQFAEQVLSKEAVAVWAPKANPFDKPWSEARHIDELWRVASEKNNSSPLVRNGPSSRWFGSELSNANYRENALTGFYADQVAALADGLQADEIEEVTMPYAMPLWVEKGGRIVALKDIRHVPEMLSVPPQKYMAAAVGNTEGIVVNLLRQSRGVEAVYREEVPKWREWKEGAEDVDREALFASIRRVLEADMEFSLRFPSASSFIDHFVDGNMWKAVEGVPIMKPLEGWDEADSRFLALLAQRFVGDGSADDVFEVLTAIDGRLRVQDADRAKDAAKAALRQVAESVKASAEDDVEKVRHEDAGVKIGGARKDFHRRAMTYADIEGMTEFERNSLVVKKNVWPPLDYEAMREAGVAANAAVAIKYLKDSINVAPDRRHHKLADDPEGTYIEAVGAVRDAMAEVKTLDEFAQTCHALYKKGQGDTNYIYGGSAFQVALGSDTCNLLCGSETNYGSLSDRQVDVRVPYKVQMEIRKRVREGAEWSFLIKPKREKSEAEKEAATERSDQERELHRPHLDVVERIGGEDWRAGRDVNAQDLMDHFGFRAIEFGNWLPQDERQSVLNMSFDSLCDLADALGIPPKGISLGGELAVAFGSRGSGGKNAALAHFEPGRYVANLTRMKGAGSLAHEWFHGLDWHLGGATKFLTEQGRPRYDGDPMPKLVAALSKRPSTPEEVLDRSKELAERCNSYAASWARHRQSEETSKTTDKLFDDFFERAKLKLYEEAARQFANNPRAAVHGDGAVNLSMQHDLGDSVVAEVRKVCRSNDQKLLKKEVDAIDNNVTHMLRNMSRWMTVEAARDLGVTLDDRFLGGVNAVDTGYLTQAKALDTKRSSPYWATDLEMFARAGAQFVYYELAERGVRSDYLVFGADEERHMQHPIGNPNPVGMDRLALREHFSALIEDYRIQLLRSMDAQSAMEP